MGLEARSGYGERQLAFKLHRKRAYLALFDVAKFRKKITNGSQSKMDRIDRSRNRGDRSTPLGCRMAERRAPPLHVAYSKKHVQNQYAASLANFNRHGAVAAAAAAAVCAFSASSCRGLIGLAASSPPLLPAVLPLCLTDVAADERSPSCVCVVRLLLATRSGTRF